MAETRYVGKPQPVAEKAQPRHINQESMTFGGPGKGPLPPGAVISVGEDDQPKLVRPKKLSPREQEMYAQLGLDEDQALTEEFAEKLSNEVERVKRAAALEGLSAPVPLDTPALSLGDEVDISKLPEAKQRELREYARKAADFAAAIENEEIKEIDPSIKAAIAAAEDEEEGINIVDDTTEEPEAEAPEKKPEPRPKSKTGVRANTGFCPRCEWDLSQPDTTKVTDDDKTNFVMLGIGKKSFMKKYSLMGGNLYLTIRQLKPYELDAITYHVYKRRQNGDITSIPEMTADMVKYRGALQIVRMETNADDIVFPEELSAWPEEEGKPVLDSVYEAVRAEFAIETIYRLAYSTVAEFGNLVGKLEAESRNPDFWKGCPRPN